ncbi:MAG: beta-lactamase family protein [Oscillospiraceae bacterium]|jgi:CubicO group peptidase (beta-lactamase class C family)|nr:beta-lactamase family protein [Oscillospiraceae bacterium]
MSVSIGTKILACILSFFAFFSVTKGEGQPNNIPETRFSDVELAQDKYGIWPDEDFTVADPASMGVNAKQLDNRLALAEKLNGAQYSDSFLVLRGGRLVYERYFNGYDENTPHYLASVTKSFISALTGIAIRDGYVQGVDQKVADFFPEAVITEESKRDMTIEHLLTMTSGLHGDAAGDDFWEEVYTSDNPGKVVFELAQTDLPGEKYSYDSMAVNLLAFLLARAVGKDLFSYAKEVLFEPLGMDSVVWGATDTGWYEGGYGIDVTPRDMLRFGYLYLNQGRWKDTQILPVEWVLQSPSKTQNFLGYGRLFWNERFNNFQGFYQANGANGQFINIYPSLDMVVVQTSNTHSDVRDLLLFPLVQLWAR